MWRSAVHTLPVDLRWIGHACCGAAFLEMQCPSPQHEGHCSWLEPCVSFQPVALDPRRRDRRRPCRDLVRSQTRASERVPVWPIWFCPCSSIIGRTVEGRCTPKNACTLEKLDITLWGECQARASFRPSAGQSSGLVKRLRFRCKFNNENELAAITANATGAFHWAHCSQPLQ